MRQHYTILGVNQNSSRNEVKAAYIRLARQYHPDKSKQIGSPSFVAIHDAYTAISAQLDRKKREEEQQAKINNLQLRVNKMMEMLEETDSSSQQEIQDDYFDMRLKTMNEQYQKIKQILGKNVQTQESTIRPPQFRVIRL